MAIRYLSGINVDSNTLFVDDANNRVGIGTASPTQALDVTGRAYISSGASIGTTSTAGTGLTVNGSTVLLSFVEIQQGNLLYLYSSGNTYYSQIYQSGQNLILSPYSNVGIGTTSPAVKFVVSNAGASGFEVDPSGGVGGGPVLQAYNRSTSAYMAQSYYALSHTFNVGSGGSTRAIDITSTGNVGIGTTSPGTKLVIVGGDDAAGVGVLEIQTAGGTNLKIGGNSTYSWIQSHSSKPLYINQLGNNVILNSGGGNVGIGTTSPSVRLQVDNNTHNYIQVNSSVANVQTALNVTNSASTSRATLSWEDGTRGAYADLYSSTYLTFTTQSSEKMRITAAGTVAIGNAGSGGGYGIEINNSASTPRIDLVDNSNYTAQLKSNGLVVTLQNNSNNALVFGTNGTERARVTAAGNFGIGTTSPARKLDIVSTNAQIRISDGTANTYWEIMSLFFQSNQDFIIQNQNNVGILINSSGNVGVGTQTPGAKIHVVGTESRFGGVASGFISVYNATGRSGYIQANGGTDLRIASDSDPMTMYVNGSERMRISSAGALKLNAYGSGSNTGTATQRLAVDASGNVIEIPIGSGPVDGNGTANYVTKWSDTDTITNSIIYDNGTNVGIGTTSPGYKLHVNGDTFFNGSSIVSGNAQVLTINGTNHAYYAWSIANTRKAYAGFGSSGSTTFELINENTGGFIIGTNGGQQIIINSAGNVGIGTTSAASKLHVLLNGNTSGGPTGNVASFQNSSAGNNAYVTLFGAYNAEAGIVFTDESEQFKGKIGYNNNSENMYFQTDGTERLRIDSSGYIYLNTYLFAYEDVSYTRLYRPNGAAGIYLGGTGDQANYYDNTTHYFRSSGGGTYYAIINSSGNVGINTTSPSYKLDVRGNIFAVGPNGGPGIIGIWEAENIASTGGSIVSDSSASGGSAWTTNGNYQLFGPYTNLPRGNYRLSVRVKVADASYTGNAVRINAYIPSVGSAQDRYIKGIDFSANDTWEMFSIPFKITGITANNVEFYVFGLNSQSISVDYLSVTVDNDSYTAQNWGNLYVNGNVGIGTTAQLARTTILSDSSAQTIGLIGRSADNIATIRWWNNAGNTVYTAIESNANYTIYNTVTNGYAAFFTNNSERLRITSAGNVGIGTTNPIGNLEISTPSGDTIFRSVVAAGGTASSNDLAIKQDFISGVTANYLWSNSNYTLGVGRNGGTMPTTEAEATALSSFVVANTGNVGIGNSSPTQALHVTGNARVTGAYYDSNNEAGTSGQVLSSTGSGTDWVTPATTTASSLYDLLPAARVAYDWTVQMTSGTWADIFSSNTVLSNGTWMVQVYVSDFASGGQQYQETYSGVMSWGNANSTNQGGASAISEVVLHRSGHAANAGQFYLRTQERASSTLLLQGMVNYSHTSNTTINFKFVKVF